MPKDGMYGSRKPTDRERRIIEAVAEGCTNRDIAGRIGTTEAVVKNYLRVIFDKLGVWNRLELALWYEANRPWEALPSESQPLCEQSQSAV